MDLSTIEQPFVLEATQIHIPGYPDAFNPSIVRWKNRLLLSFRSRNLETNRADLIGLTWLDKDFKVVGRPQLIEMAKFGLKSSYIQDPRLITIRDQLYMPYSDLVEDPDSEERKRKMCIAKVDFDGARFIITEIDTFHEFEGDTTNKFEKNWAPFSYQNLLLFSYTLAPHKVFLPLIGESRCATIADNQNFSQWSWGTLRGGTPALKIENHYLAFFHSSISLKSVQSNQQTMTHYFMGAYLFQDQPPFAIEKISPMPIISPDFYKGPNHKTWKPLRVIFPCGFIYDENFIWVSYGRQDHEAWLIKLDRKKLMKSLIPFNSNI